MGILHFRLLPRQFFLYLYSFYRALLVDSNDKGGCTYVVLFLGNHTNNPVALGEHDNILEVMSMPRDRHTLILLKVILVHDSTVPMVTALARVGVAELEPATAAAMRDLEIIRKAGVHLALSADGGRGVAGVVVKVHERLEAEFFPAG